MKRRPANRLPSGALRAIVKRRVRPTRWLLTVSVARQEVTEWERDDGKPRSGRAPAYQFRERYVASTSRFGIGQKMDSNRTPLGLHRIARKIGGGLASERDDRQTTQEMSAAKERENAVHEKSGLSGAGAGFHGKRSIS